jgi:dTDP-glucose 4,6-dehydratase
MIIKGLAGDPLPVYGLALVFERGCVGETYNVGGRNERTNLHVVKTICGLLDRFEPVPSGPRRRLISFVTDRPGHDRRYAIDATKIETELGWRARETFETGLERTVAWFLQNRDWWQGILERGYQAQRVGVVEAHVG